MKHRHSSIIMGTAVGAAAIAVLLDHTRQRLPAADTMLAEQQAVIIIDEGEALPAEPGDCAPARKPGKRAAPCSL